MMNPVLKKLSGGDLRSEGRAAEVAGEIVRHPELLTDLAEGLDSAEKLLRARTCMTMEVISRDHPDLLADVVRQLIEVASTDTVPQVRWHVAEVFGNLPLSDDDAERLIPILLGYLQDKSKFVKYCAVQTLGVLGGRSPARTEIVARITVLRGESKSLAKAVNQALQRLGPA